MDKKYIKNNQIPIYFEKQMKKLYPTKFSKINELKNISLFLHGKPGTGKTLNAISIVFNSLYENKSFQNRLKNNPDAADKFVDQKLKFVNVSDLLFKLRQTYKQQFWKKNENDLSPEEQILYSCQKVDYLILDDLGVEKTTDWALQTLYLVVNYRYENEKITIVTSNYSINELEDKMEDGRIISRITAMDKIIHCTTQYRNI